jgi:hypothetical protein
VRGLVINHFENGVYIFGGSNNTIEGNYIGTNATGTTGSGNPGTGVILRGSANTIGGTTAAARNVISCSPWLARPG